MLAECEALLEKECGGKAFLVPSCTAALELSCRLILSPGDEVIMPSWTFPSCPNSVILAGGIPVFVDVDHDLNIRVDQILPAITRKTKAIMPVHYAGVVCDMSRINAIAKMHGLYVIEDAAQALGVWGVSGDFGCVSFHLTKNVSCGEGGVLIVNNHAFIERAEILRDCGTTKAKYRRGETDGYDWIDVGSSYLMSEATAEKLYAELLRLEDITRYRRKIWSIYSGSPHKGNGHIFWLEVEDKWNWIKEARKAGIKASSHYDALHLTVPGRKYGRTGGPIIRATQAMEKLVKLNTGVSEDEAHLTAEWVSTTRSTPTNTPSSLDGQAAQTASLRLAHVTAQPSWDLQVR